MKRGTFIKLSLLIACSLPLLNCQAQNDIQTKAEKNGWRLAIQSYTFHQFTLVEALDKTQELGVHYMEVFPGHKMGGQWGETVFDFNIDAHTRKDLKALAASKGIKLVGTGVYTTDDSSTWEKMFQLAKDLDMEFITCEPADKDWDLVEGLVKKYDIQVSVHNHPQPSEYWCPENLLKQIATRDARIGSCSDVGHWRREGRNQIDCLKQLQGRIISLHFKDIAAKSEGSEEQHDVIWGTGILDVKGMLDELKRQQFKGVFSIEYEYNWDNSVPDIKKCIEYFNKTVDNMYP